MSLNIHLHCLVLDGVLSPYAKLRAAIIPQPAHKDGAPLPEHVHGKAARTSWAQRLKREFHIDVERCTCGGKLKIIAAIEDPVLIVRILTHLSLPARAPPRSPAWEPSLIQSA